jgi:phosphate starvation-inducible protein PhoH
MRIGNGSDWCLIVGFKSIDGIDFCEVTKEDVLESEEIGIIIGNRSTLVE